MVVEFPSHIYLSGNEFISNFRRHIYHIQKKSIYVLKSTTRKKTFASKYTAVNEPVTVPILNNKILFL